MKPLNKSATKTFLKLVEGLDHVGANKKLDNAPESFMAACCEIIDKPAKLRDGCSVVSLTHYYEQGGDLVTDPEVTFLLTAEKTVFPMTFEQGGQCYRVWARIEDGQIKYNKRGQADLVSFCNDWMKNIAEQQEL